MWKQNTILLIAFAILALSVYNAFDDDSEMDQHYEFFTDMRNFKEETKRFMNRGDRNTAEMGYETCVMQNRHSKLLGAPLRDCCGVYFDGNKEKCLEAER